MIHNNFVHNKTRINVTAHIVTSLRGVRCKLRDIIWERAILQINRKETVGVCEGDAQSKKAAP